MNDETWMKRALRLAEKGKGRTSSNPMVGAVLVKKGKVVGEGYHARAGEAHGEIVALREAGREAKGSTLYINLEPCTHHGKTPPCVPAVIGAGVRKVMIGMVDPNPLVKGKGVSTLRKAGIDVHVGTCEKECKTLNEAFCKYIIKREPFVILKVAATLDGKMATRNGESKWISSEASRRLVHRLRNEVDAVLVGVDTVLVDDPFLTARIRGGRDPYRIILDSQLRIPEESKVIGAPPSRTLVATTEMAPRDKIERLERRGVRVLVLGSREGRVDLKAFVRELGTMGFMSLLVEGGSQINGAFLDEGLIDKFLFFLSPRVMGDSQALGIFGGKGAEQISQSTPIRELSVKKIGGDLLIQGYREGRGESCSLEL